MSDLGLAKRLEELAAEARASKLSLVEAPDSGSLETALRKIEDLEVALERRTVIGQATGRVMERFNLSDEAAFAVLCRLSQDHNRKVYEIARELVSSGHVEEL